jgi:membrane protein implicated in regulation of membrane protease activity
MKWASLGLAIGGAIAALVAGFGYHNWPWTIGGIVFFALGIIILILYRDNK